MITKEKLGLNLELLRQLMPQKPKDFTSDHPNKIGEALNIYSNTRSVHSVEICTKGLNEEFWPLPLWVNPDNIKVGFLNSSFYRKFFKSIYPKQKYKGVTDFNFLWIPFVNKFHYKIEYDKSILDIFDVNVKYIQLRLVSNPLLKTKIFIIDDFFKVYKSKNWVAAICTIFPLLDFVARKLLNTSNLGKDIGVICKLFSENGFSKETTDYLMPFASLVSIPTDGAGSYMVDSTFLHDKVKRNKFGIIGPALSSFLRFANSYYGYYRDDTLQSNLINRHGILHGSIDEFGNKVNAVKLVTFLFLLIELEPVFAILLKED